MSRNQNSVFLDFSKSIRSLATKQDAFAKACESLKDFTTDALGDIGLQIQAKQDELKEMKKKFENERKDLQIKNDQFIEEYKYNAALKILKSRGEEPIESNEFKRLRKELAELQGDRAEEIDAAVSEEKSRGRAALEAALRNSELTHKAETATLNATVEQQKHEISHLQSTIEQLRTEVAAQRELSRQIAEAAQKGAINQYMGKNQ
jgi:HAMP domain-containing protein